MEANKVSKLLNVQYAKHFFIFKELGISNIQKNKNAVLISNVSTYTIKVVRSSFRYLSRMFIYFVAGYHSLKISCILNCLVVAL